MGFGGSKPSPSSLRDATSPERGRFYAANRQMQKAPPSGELSSVCETERVSSDILTFLLHHLLLLPASVQGAGRIRQIQDNNFLLQEF